MKALVLTGLLAIGVAYQQSGIHRLAQFKAQKRFHRILPQDIQYHGKIARWSVSCSCGWRLFGIENGSLARREAAMHLGENAE